MVFNETLEANQNVCTLCGHHFRLGALERLQNLCDPNSLEFHDENLVSQDVLGFVDSKPYSTRIEQSCAKTGRNDAFLSTSASIQGIDVEIGTFDFRYMGGSMGSVVGEMITRMVERATERRHPCVIISASGGARMQEGVLSLMQMAKTAGALSRLKDDAGMPYISILTHPTTGGVAASFAMLGDLILAEPEALIGFAGPRVIKETIGEDLPDGFQTSEYLLANGMLDAIVPRAKMRETVGQLLRQLMNHPAIDEQEDLENVGNRAVAAGGPVLVKPARGNGK
jgi:acetyl-CoA carboxylase carboxyl transferase subunit beta